MKFLGKKINYIQLHNFLSRIDAESIQSRLHFWYPDLITQYEERGIITWNRYTFSEEEYLEVLKEEEGTLRELHFKQITPEKIELIFYFESGNEYFALLNTQEQIAQVMQFLVDYPERRNGVIS